VNFALRGGTLRRLRKIEVICYQPMRYVATANTWACAACSGVLAGSVLAGRQRTYGLLTNQILALTKEVHAYAAEQEHRGATP